VATILIVEDRRADRQYLASLFRYGGDHTILEASDGAEALAIVEQRRPDLVISDLLMPKMDGYAFARRVRGNPDLAGIPIIFYSAAYHEREARSLAEQCGVIDVLTKPSEPEIILARVDAVLKRGARAGPSLTPRDEAFDLAHVNVLGAKLIEKMRALEVTEHRLTSILHVGQELAIERNPARLLERISAAARQVSLAQHAVVAVLDEDGASVGTAITSGLESGVRPPLSAGPLEDSIVGPVIAERRPVRRTNPSGRPEDLGFPARPFQVFSYLAVPLASPSRVYGWLSARNKLGASEFSDADEEMLVTLGTQAGIALENVRLLDEVNRHALALTKKDARTRFAHEAARLGVWELDLNTRRLSWSDDMAHVFGIPPARFPVFEQDAYDLVQPEDRQVLRQALDTSIETRTEFSTEMRFPGADGGVHWAQLQGRAEYDANDRPVRVLGVAIEITARKALESQFRQAQKMEAIGQLAGGVAHDFNNLLTAIAGFTELLMVGVSPDDPRHADLCEISRAAERATELTRQLLAFSRKQILQPKIVDVNQLIADIQPMLRRLIFEHIDLVVSPAPDVSLVKIDPTQLEQILVNLAVNAVDAMPQGGRLTIETTNVTRDDTHWQGDLPSGPGDYVMVGVTDTGSGMDDATRQRIFEPFFTTKGVGRGTGLGLATVDGIVKQSGGDIRVESEPGRGSTFRICLPTTTDYAPSSERRSAAAADVPRGSETVLLVEDDDAVRLLARRTLERIGYNVLQASNPKEAVRRAGEFEGPIHLLLSDVIMPESEGPPLFDRLAKKRNLRVLYMSGYADDAIVRHSGLAEGTPFLQKPFTPQALARRVRETLDR
jgi:PAS domain S-box-containing protein